MLKECPDIEWPCKVEHKKQTRGHR